MDEIKKIKISEDYSTMVKGRYHPKDGKFTGQRFREEFLEPIFNKYQKIIIDLDDSYGYPSSFREEAFGGLARKFSIDEVLAKIEFICIDEPPLIKMIINDIKDAEN
ncbi:MAG TPA: DUF4325 domain-containing protein [Crocinitomix sp.]|nr:DUF4325 domain-containing protein [Crocinitomix sp.]